MYHRHKPILHPAEAVLIVTKAKEENLIVKWKHKKNHHCFSWDILTRAFLQVSRTVLTTKGTFPIIVRFGNRLKVWRLLHRPLLFTNKAGVGEVGLIWRGKWIGLLVCQESASSLKHPSNRSRPFFLLWERGQAVGRHPDLLKESSNWGNRQYYLPTMCKLRQILCT